MTHYTMTRPADDGQLALPFDVLPIVRVSKQRLSLDDYFRAFDKANPHVYHALKRLALEVHAAGRERIGAKLLIERLRWDYAISTQGSEFGLDNSLTSRYARRLAADPDLAGLRFELRELRS